MPPKKIPTNDSFDELETYEKQMRESIVSLKKISSQIHESDRIPRETKRAMIQKLVMEQGHDWILAEFLLKSVRYKGIEAVNNYVEFRNQNGKLTHTFVALG